MYTYFVQALKGFESGVASIVTEVLFTNEEIGISISKVDLKLTLSINLH